MARLGAEVTIVEAADRLLPGEDPRAGAALRSDGVTVRTRTTVAGADPGGVDLAGGGRVDADTVLVALGRVPDTRDLDVDPAGVRLDAHGYVVTGHPAFTHVAGVHGSLAASNAVLGLRRETDLSAIPRVTFTAPEVASVGARHGHTERSGVPRRAPPPCWSAPVARGSTADGCRSAQR